MVTHSCAQQCSVHCLMSTCGGQGMLSTSSFICLWVNGVVPPRWECDEFMRCVLWARACVWACRRVAVRISTCLPWHQMQVQNDWLLVLMCVYVRVCAPPSQNCRIAVYPAALQLQCLSRITRPGSLVLLALLSLLIDAAYI